MSAGAGGSGAGPAPRAGRAGGAGTDERRPRLLDLRALSATGATRLAADIAGARLVCFPTDTVYGVGGVVSPAVAQAVADAKGRDEAKPLQTVYPSTEVLLGAVPLTPRLSEAVRCLLPGPFTLLLPYPAGLAFPPPGRVVHDEPGGSGATALTLGVRVPRWPSGAAALAGLPFPLLASSANPSGAPAPGSLDEVDPALLAACDLVLDAGAVHGLASTVLDLSEYEQTGRRRIVRAGAAGEDEIDALLARKETS
jgi:L-threonylcarbamoyladenylate synthase